MKAIDFSKIPYKKELREVSDCLTPVAVILLHLYASLALMLYGHITVSFLIKSELACLIVLFVMQIYRINKIWLWCVLLVNAVFVPLLNARHHADKMMMIYVGLILALLVFKQIAVSRTVFLIAHFLPAVTLTYFLAMGEPSYMYLDYYEVLDKQINPNMFGILALACMMHWMCYFDMLPVKAGYRFLGKIAGMILGLTYIIDSECRSALIGAAVFLVLQILWWKPWQRRVCQVATVLTMIFMLYFPVAYIRISELAAGKELLGKLLFSGRQDLWNAAIPIIKENLMFGAGTSLDFSVHHTLLELVLCIGLVPLLTFLILCGRADSRKGNHSVSRVAQMAFLGCLFVGIFESIFTIQYLYVFFISFLLSAVENESAGDGS